MLTPLRGAHSDYTIYPKLSDEDFLISGSQHFFTPNIVKFSSDHSNECRSISMVLLAFVESVTMLYNPVSLAINHVSIVPNTSFLSQSSDASISFTPASLSKSQRIFTAEKYVLMGKPHL